MRPVHHRNRPFQQLLRALRTEAASDSSPPAHLRSLSHAVQRLPARQGRALNRREFLTLGSASAALLLQGCGGDSDAQLFRQADADLRLANDFIVQRQSGQNGERYLSIASIAGLVGTIDRTFEVPANSLYVSVTLTGHTHLQAPADVAFMVHAPDGARVNILEEGQDRGFALLLLEQPSAGEWSISLQSTRETPFLCEVRVLPILEDIDTADQETLDLQLNSLLDFADQLPRSPAFDDMVEAAVGPQNACEACRIAMGVVFVAIGLIVILVAFALGLISPLWPPAAIIAGVIGTLGIKITAGAVAGLLIDIIRAIKGRGELVNVDTLGNAFCTSLGRCS